MNLGLGYRYPKGCYVFQGGAVRFCSKYRRLLSLQAKSNPEGAYFNAVWRLVILVSGYFPSIWIKIFVGISSALIIGMFEGWLTFLLFTSLLQFE